MSNPRPLVQDVAAQLPLAMLHIPWQGVLVLNIGGNWTFHELPVGMPPEMTRDLLAQALVQLNAYLDQQSKEDKS